MHSRRYVRSETERTNGESNPVDHVVAGVVGREGIVPSVEHTIVVGVQRRLIRRRHTIKRLRVRVSIRPQRNETKVSSAPTLTRASCSEVLTPEQCWAPKP